MIKTHTALFLALASSALAAQPAHQTLTVEPPVQEVKLGETVTVTIVYDSDHPSVAGVGLRLHYDSSKLTLLGSDLLHPTGIFGRQDQPDAGDPYLARFDDGDPATDRRYIASWQTWNSDWPGEAAGLPLELLRLRFQTKAGAAATSLTLTGSPCAVCNLDLESAMLMVVDENTQVLVPTAATPEPTAAPPTPTPTTTPTPSLDPPTGGLEPSGEIPGIPTLSGLGTLMLVAALAGSAVMLLFRQRS